METQEFDSVSQIQEAGIRFKTEAGGMHLVIDGMDERGQPETIDFYPLRGMWRVRRKPITGCGVQTLLNRVKP